MSDDNYCKTLTSVLRQDEQLEQIEIMAKQGTLCKGIENDKENIPKSELCKKVNVKWCVSKVPQYIFPSDKYVGFPFIIIDQPRNNLHFDNSLASN